MPRRTPEVVVARANRAWAKKRRWYGLFYECWLLAAPGMSPYFGGWEPGQGMGMSTAGIRRHEHLFDSTLCRATERLPNRMVAELFPYGEPWAHMRPGPLFGPEDSNPERAKDALDAVEERVFAALHASNVQLPLVMTATDGVVSGTGLLKAGLSRDSATLLEFEAVNQSEAALERGPGHQVWGINRKMDLTLEWMRVYWPEARGLPAEDPAEAAKHVDEQKKWTVHESTYYDPMSTVWYSDVVVEDLEGGTRRIHEKDYLVCPWVVWRYSLLPGEVQGRSPVMAALPTTRTLNYAKRVRLESASIRVGGMFTYQNDGIFNPNTVRFASGRLIPVGSNLRENPTLQPLQLAGDVQLGELIIADEKQDIREIMHDYPQPEPQPGMTAFEFGERDAEAKQNRGHAYHRMAEEMGRPLLRLSTYLLSEAGMLPELQEFQAPLPDGRPRPLLLDGSDVRVEFASPLAQAQRMQRANRTFSWVRNLQETIGPQETMRTVASESVTESTAEDLDVDPALVRSEDEIARRDAAMQEAAEGAAMQGGVAPTQPGQLPGMV